MPYLAITKAMKAWAKKFESLVNEHVTEVKILEHVWVYGQNSYDREETQHALSIIASGPKIKLIIALGRERQSHWNRTKKRMISEITFVGSGHTFFLTPRGWRSFDRTGVSDSFYPVDWESKTLADPAKLVADQLLRIAKWLEQDTTMIDVPEIGFRVTPQRKAEQIAFLKEGRGIEFRPSGFGTGYHLSTRRRYRYDRRASSALAAFYEVEQLYITTLDCD